MTSTPEGELGQERPVKRLAMVPPDIADIIGIARRGWFWLIACTVFGLTAALVGLSAMPPVYKASARIMFERTSIRYMHTNRVTNEPIIEDMDTLGQTYVIPSESILLPVVRSLALASDPTFVGEKDVKTLRSRIGGLLRTAAHAMGLPEKQAEELLKPHDEPEKVAVEILNKNLSVNREDVPSVITISFTWNDPKKAALIVNEVVDTYQRSSTVNKRNITKTASEHMQDRLEEQRRRSAEAERDLVEFKSANNGLEVARNALDLSHSMQYHLTQARMARAEAKARKEKFESSAGSIDLVPDNEITSRLRAQLLDLGSRANDIEGRVGKDHLAAVKIRERMEEIRQAIADEKKRVASTFGNEYEAARTKYEALRAEIDSGLKNENNIEAEARLRELAAAADASRTVYNQMLQQISEKTEAQTPIAPDARVLARAMPPTQTEKSKKRLLVLAGGSMMGLLLGCAVVFGRNFPLGVFRSTQQVADATGLDCVILPLVIGRKKQASLRSGEYALGAPYSRFAETLRNVWASISIAQRQGGAKVVGVLSSIPGEGKTTLAVSLAAHGARYSRARILVIDADFHRQSLTERIAADTRVGLREALEEPENLARFVVRSELLNLDTLPCPTSARIPNSAELLGSLAMEKLIDTARKSYDLVIIEAPPMAAVVDYKMIEQYCDHFVFVVEWGKTSQRILFESLEEAPRLFDRILCVVLNKADPTALKTIESYKGNRFNSYFSDKSA